MKIRGAAAAPAYRPGSTFPDGPAIEISAPRDRDGSFEPKIVKKRQKRLPDVDDMAISVRECLTLGEVQAGHLAEVYGADVSRQTISTIIDKAMDGMAEWQNRPPYVFGWAAAAPNASVVLPSACCDESARRVTPPIGVKRCAVMRGSVGRRGRPSPRSSVATSGAPPQSPAACHRHRGRRNPRRTRCATDDPDRSRESLRAAYAQS